MHGLMGDRFLKWLVGGMMRQPRLQPTVESKSEPGNDEETTMGSDNFENGEDRGEEELGNYTNES